MNSKSGTSRLKAPQRIQRRLMGGFASSTGRLQRIGRLDKERISVATFAAPESGYSLTFSTQNEENPFIMRRWFATRAAHSHIQHRGLMDHWFTCMPIVTAKIGRLSLGCTQISTGSTTECAGYISRSQPTRSLTICFF